MQSNFFNDYNAGWVGCRGYVECEDIESDPDQFCQQEMEDMREGQRGSFVNCTTEGLLIFAEEVVVHGRMPIFQIFVPAKEMINVVNRLTDD